MFFWGKETSGGSIFDLPEEKKAYRRWAQKMAICMEHIMRAQW
jgi:hypothetical protein